MCALVGSYCSDGLRRANSAPIPSPIPRGINRNSQSRSTTRPSRRPAEITRTTIAEDAALDTPRGCQTRLPDGTY